MPYRLTRATQAKFQRQLTEYYQQNRRDFPWRQTANPYHVMVSEVMLQQTQAVRVVSFYQRFLQHFPTVKALADAPAAAVLTAWQGLGYNRRALYLQQAAKIIEEQFKGTFPKTSAELTRLPGIGYNTAGAILTYAFNKPTVFIETNIRKVIIHHFFSHAEKVSDKEIATVLEQVVDQDNPREWYWAMMDYGSFLGSTKAVTNARSKHYVKQTQFVGSKRFTRSQILKYVLRSSRPRQEIQERFIALPYVESALNELISEGFCSEENGLIQIRN